MSNEQQIEYWNAEAGENWVVQAEALDLMMHDIAVAILAQATLQVGNRVLDIGCGSGALTLAAQDCVGPAGTAIGLDISQPLLQNARRRALKRNSPATFVEGDAATWQSDSKADAVISRFGVMFFDNPAAAFANILQLTKHDGSLNFACWRDPKGNDLACGLMKAASHLFTLPSEKPDPKAPGPFAFADQDYVLSLLIQAGWHDVRFETWDGYLPLPTKSARDNAELLARMGSIGRTAREQNIAIERVVEALIPFLEERNKNGRYALKGTAWLVSARR